jgi:hypothetical protein
MSDLPDFPVDDSTLAAIEHALGGALTFDGENGERLAEPRLVGADYSLSTLLDFLAGCTGRDPNEELIQPGRDESDLPEWERGRGGWSDAEIVYDTRPHYSEHDLIAALIAEIRSLREDQDHTHQGEAANDVEVEQPAGGQVLGEPDRGHEVETGGDQQAPGEDLASHDSGSRGADRKDDDPGGRA